MTIPTSNQPFKIKRAQRSHARLRMAMAGVSGSGKTKGALRMARGIVSKMMAMGLATAEWDGKIALIDTERKSAALYADTVPFDTIELEPPYSVDRYQQALMQVEQMGYLVCIIDQVSHAWAGPGGQLEFIDTLKAQAKNAISPWAKVTPMQQEFYDRMLRSPLHLIITMRAKSEWVIEDVPTEGGRTKKVPRKIGLSPVQREGIEYEFTTMLDIELETHTATASKDRTGLFADRTVKIDEDTGAKLAEWLYTGEKTIEDPAAVVEGEKKEIAPPSIDLVFSDITLGFVEAATLPDLAGHFDAGQKAIKAFIPALGAEVVKPWLDKLIAAKDARKAALAGSAATTTQPGAQQLVAKPPAPDQDLAGVKLLAKNDLKSIRTMIKATRIEGLEAAVCHELGVEKLDLLPLSRMAECTGKVTEISKREAAQQA